MTVRAQDGVETEAGEEGADCCPAKAAIDRDRRRKKKALEV
jgi:hypothetical protein